LRKIIKTISSKKRKKIENKGKKTTETLFFRKKSRERKNKNITRIPGMKITLNVYPGTPEV